MTVREIVKRFTFIEIFKGMALTLSRMLSHAVTIQYPKERRPIRPGYRGLHALTRHPDGKYRCVGCGLCAAVCPSKCIHIYTSEGEGYEKIVERYEVEVLRCIFCGLCVEACPYRAIALTENYEFSNYNKDELYMTMDKLLSNWDKYMAGRKDEEYFKRFWRPMSEDFGTPPGQAIFRGKEQ